MKWNLFLTLFLYLTVSFIPIVPSDIKHTMEIFSSLRIFVVWLQIKQCKYLFLISIFVKNDLLLLLLLLLLSHGLLYVVMNWVGNHERFQIFSKMFKKKENTYIISNAIYPEVHSRSKYLFYIQFFWKWHVY